MEGLCLVGLGFAWSREPAGVSEPLVSCISKSLTQALRAALLQLQPPDTEN